MSTPASLTFKVPVNDQVAVTVKAAVPTACRPGGLETGGPTTNDPGTSGPLADGAGAGTSTTGGRESGGPTPAAAALILAHGANNDLDHPLLVYFAAHLASKNNVLVVRFNFPYVEREAPSPDPKEALGDAFRRVHNYVVDELGSPGTPVFLGGKSLGSIVAAELISRGPEGEGLPAAGFIALGYPLHAPERTDRLHVEPLRRIGVPSLFFLGTRDPFCHPDLLRPIVAGLSHSGELHMIDGGDHSFHLPSSSGRQPEDAFGEIAQRTAGFIEEVVKEMAGAV